MGEGEVHGEQNTPLRGQSGGFEAQSWLVADVR